MFLGMLKFLPAWLVILVVSRDILIVGAVILSGSWTSPAHGALMISKINTAAQIVSPAPCSCARPRGRHRALLAAGMALVATFTAASGALHARMAVPYANGGTR
jgi:cardiolipin synthase